MELYYPCSGTDLIPIERLGSLATRFVYVDLIWDVPARQAVFKEMESRGWLRGGTPEEGQAILEVQGRRLELVLIQGDGVTAYQVRYPVTPPRVVLLKLHFGGLDMPLFEGELRRSLPQYLIALAGSILTEAGIKAYFDEHTARANAAPGAPLDDDDLWGTAPPYSRELRTLDAFCSDHPDERYTLYALQDAPELPQELLNALG